MNPLSSTVHPFNPLSLLSMLEESDIPSSFQLMEVSDHDQQWLKDTSIGKPDVKDQFEAKGWTLELETIWNIGWKQDEDWLFVRKCE